jgi:hypothetical protein
MKAAFLRMALLLVTGITSVQVVNAESLRQAEVRAIGGYVGFLDDGGTLNHWAGGSIRYFFTRRLAIEPEFLFLRESRADQDFHFIPNLVFEFFKNPGNVQPYLIGGVGLQRHRELTGTGFYSSNSAIFGGGLGAKIFVSDRWYVAPEFRIGWEPFFRITGSIGYIISGGKRKRF